MPLCEPLSAKFLNGKIRNGDFAGIDWVMTYATSKNLLLLQ